MLLKHLKVKETTPLVKRLIVEIDETVTISDGGIHLAEKAQRSPCSGIVIKGWDDISNDLIGQRVYFRAYSNTAVVLWGHTEDLVVDVVHWGDVLLVERP